MAAIKSSWNPNVGIHLTNLNKAQNNILNTNLPIYMNLVEQQARNVANAQSERNNARAKIDLAINELKSIPNTLDGIINQYDVGDIHNKINVIDEQIAAEKSKQAKSNELLALRKEQSEALIKKYSSNYHSSWLGLWRPLKENTHIGLNVTSVVLGILATAFLGYFVYIYFSSRAAGGGLQTSVRNAKNTLMTGLVGGFQKVKRSTN